MDNERHSIVALAAALAMIQDELQRSQEHPLRFAHLCEALDSTERLLFNHKDRFGTGSVNFQLGCEEFILLSNTIAMRALQQQTISPPNVKKIYDLLTSAEEHTRRAGYLHSIPAAQHVTRRLEFRLICLNNLACYYKHIDKPFAAIGFLEKVLAIQLKQGGINKTRSSKSDHSHAMALAHINLCVVLSQLQRHPAAVEHAKAAIAQLITPTDEEAFSNSRNAQLLLVSYYNLGVELEYLHDTDAMVAAYKTALRLANEHAMTPENNELVQTIHRILQEHEDARMSNRISKWRQSSPTSRRSNGFQDQRRPLSPHSLRQPTLLS